jgi:predicted phosphodiesterase
LLYGSVLDRKSIALGAKDAVPNTRCAVVCRHADCGRRLAIPASNVICTGDIIAYGADASATLALVRASGCHVVMGNVEENLAAGAADCGCGFEEGSTCDRLSAVWFGHASAQLSADDRAWLADLPRRVDLEIGGYRFAVVHGSVESVNQLVFASTDTAIKLRQLDKAGMDGVIAGHCGLPFTQSVGGRLWHNSGGIGLPEYAEALGSGIRRIFAAALA